MDALLPLFDEPTHARLLVDFPSPRLSESITVAMQHQARLDICAAFRAGASRVRLLELRVGQGSERVLGVFEFEQKQGGLIETRALTRDELQTFVWLHQLPRDPVEPAN